MHQTLSSLHKVPLTHQVHEEYAARKELLRHNTGPTAQKSVHLGTLGSVVVAFP